MGVPVAFVRADGARSRVPVARMPFQIGSGPEDDLVIDLPGVVGRHLRLKQSRGQYMVTAAEGESFQVEHQRVNFFALEHNDEIQLGGEEGGARLRFENRMEDAFVPPGASLAEAWLSHPAFRTARGPEAWGDGEALERRDPSRCRRIVDPMSGRAVVAKVLGKVRSVEDGDHHLALLSALSGAPHPNLARVVDGGISPGNQGAVRWLVTAWARGTCARDLLRSMDDVPVWGATVALRRVAGALAHLHARGVIHRDVAPSNVIVGGPTDAVLIDPGQAVVVGEARSEEAGVVGTPGYLAPEAVLGDAAAITPKIDVYGLAAVGYAFLTGVPPTAGGDVLESVARATAEVPSPRRLGIELPTALESALLHGLRVDPASRPDAATFEAMLAEAEEAAALGFAP